MAGEGLGGRITDEAAERMLGNYDETDEGYDVVSIGEYVIDNVAVASEGSELAAQIDAWEDEDWFPRSGESREVPGVPDEVEEYMDETLPGGKAPNQAAAAGMSGADTLFYGAVGAAEDRLEELYAKETDIVLQQDPDGTSAQTYIFVEEDGENRISCVKDEDGLLDEGFVDAAYGDVMDADYLLVTNGMLSEPLDYLLDELSDEPVEERPTVIYDPSPIEGAEEMLSYEAVDIATPNEVEYNLLEDALEASGATVIQTRSD
ncbi:MAG: PfkB family carbohydrate kinase, partial [Candidatus Nanohaloarchaea archaeon]|nr:PfkB family carbohydrate kinase [Candidatus Nanohaloarchaea archaeon]